MSIENLADRIRSRIEAEGRIEINSTEYFVVEWDVLLTSDQLYTYADQLAQRRVAVQVELPPDRLLGIQNKDGQMVRWKPGKVLTYAVLKQTFSSATDYQLAKQHIWQAARDWEDVCGVKFEHLQVLDDGVASSAAAPLFTVQFQASKKPEETTLIALAFFPNEPVAKRTVYLYQSYFTTTLYDKVGILRHELGHVLGFRHEHIRTEGPGIVESNSTPEGVNITPIPLSAYDKLSVMHYPPGGAAAIFDITDFDRKGAQTLYGLPYSKFDDYE